MLFAIDVYAISRQGGVCVKNATFLWDYPVPYWVKFFAWLLSMARVHTRDVLLRNTIIVALEARNPAPLETVEHLIYGCPFACNLWTSLRLSSDGASMCELHLFDASPAVSFASLGVFTLLCCWHIWKQRNAVIFREASPSLAQTLKARQDDTVLWRGKFKRDLHAHNDVWFHVLGTLQPPWSVFGLLQNCRPTMILLCFKTHPEFAAYHLIHHDP